MARYLGKIRRGLNVDFFLLKFFLPQTVLCIKTLPVKVIVSELGDSTNEKDDLAALYLSNMYYSFFQFFIFKLFFYLQIHTYLLSLSQALLV